MTLLLYEQRRKSLQIHQTSRWTKVCYCLHAVIENRVKIKYTILTLPDSDLLLYMKHNAKSGKSFYGAIPKHS